MTEPSTMPGPSMTEAEHVEHMASIGMTDKEIAVLVGCSETELHHRYNNLIARAKARSHRSLLNVQMKVALDGNVTMLTWLGRNLMGQSGEVTVEASDAEPQLVLVGIPRE